MSNRRPNPRMAKIHRSYEVSEAAKLYRVHRNTVRAWIKAGLPTVKEKRPFLIIGKDLRDFLQARRQKNRRPCRPGEIYCVRCRLPRAPAGGMADYEPQTESLGRLIGICPTCDSFVYRSVNPAKMEQVRGNLKVTLPRAHERISEITCPSVNCDFEREADEHGKAQSQ